MKEEKKRYFLIEYYGIPRKIVVSTKEEVKDVLKKVKNYNDRKNSKFLFGNIRVNHINGKYELIGHLYKKYTDRMTISELDNYTSKYTENELALMNESESLMKDGYEPDINIAYMETINYNDKVNVRYERGIKYIPVLYKDDLKYMDTNYIKKCIYFHCQTKDYEFFMDLANEFEAYHFVSDEISSLRTIIDRCANQGYDLIFLYRAATNLYKKFICEYEKDESLTRLKNGSYQISRRRLRDFGFFVKNFNIRDSKVKSPLKYNKTYPTNEYEISENGQMKLTLN